MHAFMLVPLIALAHPAQVRVRDDFTGTLASRWQVEAGQWKVGRGQLATDALGDSMIWHFSSPEFEAGAITASMIPIRRLPAGSHTGWATAGLLLLQDPVNYWHLALVEGPQGERYFELVEMLAGVWQAQIVPAHVLTFERRHAGSWQYDKPYNLTLRVQPSRIVGQVTDAATGKPVFVASFRVPNAAPAVTTGRPGFRATKMEAVFGAISASGSPRRVPTGASATAAILAGPQGLTRQVRDIVLPAVRRSGLGASVVNWQQLPEALSKGRVGVLVLPWLRSLPARARPALEAFMRRGGKLLVLGRPPLDEWAFPSRDGRAWISREEFLASVRPSSILVGFSRENITRWERATDNPGNPASREIAPGPNESTPAMRVTVAKLTGWDTLGQIFRNPFPAGHALTCFWAKGGRSTSGMIVEWREKDGSRWIASVPLTPRWRHYALPISDFVFWRDGSPPTRGGPGDRLNAANAEHLSFGVARSHLGVEGPSQEYSLAAVGTAPDPTAGLDTTPLALESISPWHKIYQTSAALVRPWSTSPLPLRWGRGRVGVWHRRPRLCRSLSSPSRGEAGVGVNLSSHGRPVEVTCSVPRTRSATLDRRPLGRWIPFLEALDSSGQSRGACGWCYLPVSGPYRGGWACIGLPPCRAGVSLGPGNVGAGMAAQRVQPPTPAASVIVSAAKNPTSTRAPAPDIRPFVTTALDILQRDAFMVRAGSRHWSYFEGEKVDLGAEIANLSDKPRNLELRWVVTTCGKRVLKGSATASPGPGESAFVPSDPRAEKASAALAAGAYSVTVQLLSRGKVVDSVTHAFRVLPKGAVGNSFVRVKGGRFVLEGKEWHPHGVNYWPSYVAGMEAAQYWGHWLSPAFYDPETVEKDLSLLERLGVNAVSVQCNAPDHLRPLNDFLARARAHGIFANVFLNGAHPLYPDDELVSTLIRQGRLAENEAIFAYDIAWEPAIGRHEQRRAWNKEWNRWIREQYGSEQNAVEQWGFEPQTRDALLDNPSDDQLVNDGPWRMTVAAYRRFADDLISRRYGRITRLIRKLDPNHLIGARTGYGGTGQPGVVPAFPFDLVSGAKHLDFVSAEGWGLSGPWEDIRTGGFTTAYGRWASNGKPVFWAEFGATIYPQTSRRKVAEQARIYQHIYRMILESDADGSAGWWFPGGLRIDENSDYGIINPDGTPRPAALALQAFAPRITKPRGAPATPVGATGRSPLQALPVILSEAKNPTPLRVNSAQNPITILIDRDLHPSGYAGIWERAKAAYLSAIQVGKPVIVKTEATGKTTATMPLVAVGNLPYKGCGTLKHANAEFNFLRIKNASGKWQAVEDGGQVKVKAGQPVNVWASVGNTGEAEWAPGATEGAVCVLLRAGVRLAGGPFPQHITAAVSRYADADLRFTMSGSQPPETYCRLRMAMLGPTLPTPEAAMSHALIGFGEQRTIKLIPVP